MGGRTCGTMAPEQCQPERQLCGTVEVHQRLLRESEAYARNRERIQDLTIQYMRGIRKTTRDVVRIPVVVHVVWSTAEQNIDDEQVRSQIEVLNRDFRRRNPDVAQVPPEWQQLAADARVEFYLATTDPSGNPTTGITRTRTSVESFTTDDAVKAKATGGADAWPAERYLNLWVCELRGGLLGYAQFPGGPEETDGVVIGHRAFGTTGTATEPFHLGRTATHEVGHWLNLYHIWGDDDGACTGSDRVEDTPNQGGANRGVPVYPHVSCDNEPSGDMFMNYMDYVDDSAMVMFTAGQVARIDACLDGPRVSFKRLPEPVQEPAPLSEEEFGYCGTMEVHQRLLRESPELAREQERIEEQTQRFVRSHRANGRLDLVRIPVVVHVVWNTREQNISVDQIQSQIDALNRDFRGQNPDISRVPEPWRNLVGDASIEFYLATEDPDGNPTSGITRTQTTLTSFTYDDRVKFRQMGGADPWPADRYLNLWVCRLRGRLLGYAQFPGMPVRTDGVVMTYTAFGTIGTAQAPFNLGRTTTHEVGHWLNLRHIWGDDDGACLGSDRVDDTPNQADKNFGRPLFPHISCGNAPNGDMFMNYMDYTDDVSRFMFTDGQVARMRAALEGPRRSFLEDRRGGAPAADGVPARRRTCATQEIHERMLRQNPEYARNRQWIERLSEEFQRGARRLERGVVRIPVVVHVVWNRPEQNVSVEQIQSQMEVLNRDFRKRNPDVSQVPTQWQQLVADARVEFYLATTDPDGNPTSGITRTRTNVTVFDYLEDRVKSSAAGGADPWPSDRYLNMWVCQISDDILGYATPPGFPPDQDGVVILYTAFGTVGSAAPPFNLGRTATHEVGHWLNLDHIWGGNSTTCGDSDNVADTPNQAGPNYQCPTHPHASCNNGGDMFMNFMDYVDDRCMMMFTAGQVARMDACLEGPRASFLVPEGRDVVAAAAARAAGPVVSWGPDRVDLFVVGADSALCHKWWDGATWHPSATEFEDLGGVVLGAPQAITWGPDRLDVFVVGTDSAVYHKWWDGAAWRPSATDWEHLGGVCVGGVKVVSTGPDRLDLFIVGTDSAVYHKAWNGGAWYPSPTHWENLGGICARPPEVVSAGPDRLDLFVTSTDSAVYHKFWDGAKWNPSVTDWEDMGDLFAGLGWAAAPGAGVEHVNAHLPS